MPEGPGLTVDEVFNVQQGVYLVEQARALGWLNLIPGTSYEAYRVENRYNPDHPPLGRWWLGLHHHLTWWLFPPHDPDGPWVTACARTGAATAFALTVIAVGCFVTSSTGPRAGLFSAAAVILMPRVFGHAHLASLESTTNMTCTLAVLAIARMWNGVARPTSRGAVFAGGLLGLALLTKIQAVLIPVPVACWVLWRWRLQGIRPLSVWGATALATFFLLWPYLWDAPIAHGLEYLGRTTNRATIYVWYWGQRFTDKQVPWHYPFVVFGLTSPTILHLLGAAGLWQTAREGVRNGWRLGGNHSNRPAAGPRTVAVSDSPPLTADRFGWAGNLLVFLCALFPLVVFACPGVAVYDGERLFLTSYPLWAILIGRGAESAWQFLVVATGRAWVAAVVCVSLFAGSAWPLFATSPCHLSYSNLLASLMDRSAARPLFEVDYWGEGVTRDFLEKLVVLIPEGSTVAIAPAMHQFQMEEYLRQSPILRSHGTKIIGFDSKDTTTRYVLVYRRLADLPEELRGTPTNGVLTKTEVAGRLLAYVIDRGD